MRKTTHLFSPEWCSCSTLHDVKKIDPSLLITNKERRKVYWYHSGENKCVVLRIGCRPYLWKGVYMGFPISNFTHAFLSKDMDEFANDGAIQYSSFAKQKKT
jgi:hypothetical protein